MLCRLLRGSEFLNFVSARLLPPSSVSVIAYIAPDGLLLLVGTHDSWVSPPAIRKRTALPSAFKRRNFGAKYRYHQVQLEFSDTGWTNTKDESNYETRHQQRPTRGDLIPSLRLKWVASYDTTSALPLTLFHGIAVAAAAVRAQVDAESLSQRRRKRASW